MEDEVILKDLWLKLFKSNASLGLYEDAYNTLMMVPYNDTCVSSVCPPLARQPTDPHSFPGRAPASRTSSRASARTARSTSSLVGPSLDSRASSNATSPSAHATPTLSPCPTTTRSSTRTTSPKATTAVVSCLLFPLVATWLMRLPRSWCNDVPARSKDRRALRTDGSLQGACDAPVPELPRCCERAFARRAEACLGRCHCRGGCIGAGEELVREARKVVLISSHSADDETPEAHLPHPRG